MTALERGASERTAGGSILLPLGQRFKAILPHVREWMRVACNHYWAAGAYEQFSRLSDAELCRRGLSRETLARDVMEAASAPHSADEALSAAQPDRRIP